jgi:hypothetical protein
MKNINNSKLAKPPTHEGHLQGVGLVQFRLEKGASNIPLNMTTFRELPTVREKPKKP